MSAKNGKLWQQFTQAQQNLTIEDWQHVAWSDKTFRCLGHKLA